MAFSDQGGGVYNALIPAYGVTTNDIPDMYVYRYVFSVISAWIYKETIGHPHLDGVNLGDSAHNFVSSCLDL